MQKGSREICNNNVACNRFNKFEYDLKDAFVRGLHNQNTIVSQLHKCVGGKLLRVVQKDPAITVNIEIVAAMPRENECSVKTEKFLDNVENGKNTAGK